MSIHNVNLDKMLNPNLGYKKLEYMRTNGFFSNCQGHLGGNIQKTCEGSIGYWKNSK